MNKIEKALKGLMKYVEGSDKLYFKENVGELLKFAKSKKPPKPLYVAAFLEEGSRQDLYNWWKMHVKKDLLPQEPKHSHMTIKYQPSKEDILSLPIGESSEKTLTVIGYAHDDLGQAVQVRVSDKSFDRMGDGIAHISISKTKETPMGFAYSNALLSQGIEEVKAGPELKVKGIGVFMSNQQVEYDLDNVFEKDNDSLELDVDTE
tara:strand:- start:263 stop:877 length:615 start_codon:yes stop_codon:yes gene_type:complete